MSETTDNDKLTMVIGAISDDISHIHVRITAAIGIAAVFVTQIPLVALRHLPGWTQWVMIAAVVTLFVSGAAYFQYTQQLNKLRLRIVSQAAPSVPGVESLSSWQDHFAGRQGWNDNSVFFFWIGQACLAAGVALVAIVLVWLIPLH